MQARAYSKPPSQPIAEIATFLSFSKDENGDILPIQ